jgi:hypothetical protein
MNDPSVWAQIMKEFGKGVQSTQVVEAVKVEEEKECDHKGHYRIAGGAYIAIRYCANCGKSWRTFTKGDYGDYPVAEWELIKERMEVEERVLPDYEE